MRTKKYPAIIIFAAIIICLFLCDACKKKEEAPMTPTKLVREIFGRPENVEDSGVISVEYDEPDYVIQYNFNPPGKAKYEEELGEELTPKIKKLFESDQNIGMVQITIFGLSKGTYGNTGWKPTLYFELDRTTYNSIDWGKRHKKNLLEAVQNLKWYRKESD